MTAATVTGKKEDATPKTASRAKIHLLDIFGKSAAVTSVVSAVVGYFTFGSLLVSATDTAARATFDPSVPLEAGLIACGVSAVAGGIGWYTGKTRKKLSVEFNRALASRLRTAQKEAEADTSLDESLRDRRDYTPYIDYSYRNDGFWQGYWLSSVMNSSGGGGSSSSRSSSGGSSFSSSDDNKGAAIVLAVVALAAALTASTYIAYKSMKSNFSGVPKLLDAPKPVNPNRPGIFRTSSVSAKEKAAVPTGMN